MKAMDEQHLRKDNGAKLKETWQYINRGNLERETEHMIIAAQD